MNFKCHWLAFICQILRCSTSYTSIFLRLRQCLCYLSLIPVSNSVKDQRTIHLCGKHKLINCHDMWFNWIADVPVYVSLYLSHKQWSSQTVVIPPPRGKVRYKIPNQSPCIPHISPGCGGGGVRLISASVFAILKLNIFSANEKFTFMSGQPINSFLLLKLKIFSGNPKNFLGPMVPWSDTFSTPNGTTLGDTWHSFKKSDHTLAITTSCCLHWRWQNDNWGGKYSYICVHRL